MYTLLRRTAFALILSTSPLVADTSLEGLKSRLVGQWISMACELRPQANMQDPALAPTPTYLKRDFTYDRSGGFSGNITVFADPTCSTPATQFEFAGDIEWFDRNPAVDGAWSQNYVLNKMLQITPLHDAVVDQLNSLPPGACGDGAFEVEVARDILGKPCVLLKFMPDNPYVVDHDMLYVPFEFPDLLFMGGKHVDGTGFYYPENRPQVGLQQPMIRVK